MKNLRKILFTGLLAISLASCNDALDIVQDGEINNEVTFKTVADLNGFLIGDIYSRVDNTTEINFTSVFTDEVGRGPDNLGQNDELHRYFFNANDGNPSSLWLNQYTLINRVNRLIEYSNLIQVNSAQEQEQLNNILAEARTLRAYAYLQLEAFFSTDMSDDNALGVLLCDFIPEFDTKLPRVSNAQIYQLIEADLLFAENNLSTDPNVNPNVGNYKYVTPALVDAIRARFYTYRKKYDLAEAAALRVFSSFGSTLADPFDYIDMWLDDAGAETIFAASRPSSGSWGNVGSLFYFNTTDINGGAFHDMGINLANLLFANFPFDVRGFIFVDPSSNFGTNDIIIDKYPGKASQPLRNDLKLFRLSEIYLILAEAQVGKSAPNLAAAAAYVQAVRDARDTNEVLPVYTTAQEAYADILVERRKELCFEGHRYLDLKRLGAAANVSIDRNIADDALSSTPLTLPLTDHRFTFPIPQIEIQGNGAIQQNPGY